ncbi:MAG TPA: hypothetical protein VHM70_08310 [Polyangiaceae bacterium]|nr:hypothetical protein [Polyangiaceae bacterium]
MKRCLLRLSPLFALACSGATPRGTRVDASAHFCARRMLVVVQASPRLDPALLGQALRDDLQNRSVQATAIKLEPDVQLTDPVVGQSLSQLAPDSLLMVNWDESVIVQNYAYGAHVDSEMSKLRASLYRLTPEHNLVEVWRSAFDGHSQRNEHAMEEGDAVSIAGAITNEAARSHLLAPCRR